MPLVSVAASQLTVSNTAGPMCWGPLSVRWMLPTDGPVVSAAEVPLPSTAATMGNAGSADVNVSAPKVSPVPDGWKVTSTEQLPLGASVLGRGPHVFVPIT